MLLIMSLENKKILLNESSPCIDVDNCRGRENKEIDFLNGVLQKSVKD